MTDLIARGKADHDGARRGCKLVAHHMPSFPVMSRTVILWEESHASPDSNARIPETTFDPSYSQLV